MADLVQNSQIKNAVRTLASPIADVTAFNLIVQLVIAENSFACVVYIIAGVNYWQKESLFFKLNLLKQNHFKNMGPAGFEPATSAV